MWFAAFGLALLIAGFMISRHTHWTIQSHTLQYLDHVDIHSAGNSELSFSIIGFITLPTQMFWLYYSLLQLLDLEDI